MKMPRTARKISETGIYHVMLRGINRQNIFEDDQDRLYFMSVLASCKKVSGFRLHAFVLMSNHIHLLLEPLDEPLDMIFRRIGTRYAVWYNRKYQRAGHLFQDRFRSENVSTVQYYQTVLRYILQNPMKAGMEKHPGEYRWSSYTAYEKGQGIVTDTQYAVELFGGRETLIQYLKQDNDDTVMDEENHDWRLRDDAARRIMRQITQCSSVSDFQKLDPDLQKKHAAEMYQERLSMGQIARLTGMSKTTVFRIVQRFKDEPSEDGQLILNESDETDWAYDAGMIW
ncbi:MAG: transposase [Clostridiales bacterium]|jgi:REP element-mobilizing transposase RayT|nr:transposase [Clostridiales bacterium]